MIWSLFDQVPHFCWEDFSGHSIDFVPADNSMLYASLYVAWYALLPLRLSWISHRTSNSLRHYYIDFVPVVLFRLCTFVFFWHGVIRFRLHGIPYPVEKLSGVIISALLWSISRTLTEFLCWWCGLIYTVPFDRPIHWFSTQLLPFSFCGAAYFGSARVRSWPHFKTVSRSTLFYQLLLQLVSRNFKVLLLLVWHAACFRFA